MVAATAELTPSPVQSTALTRVDSSAQLMTLAGQGESSFRWIQDMGKTLAESRMLKLKNPQQGAAVILAAICEGTTPFQIMREYHIMDDGGMSMKADVMLARFNAAGGKHQWVKTGDDGQEATLRLIWNGQDVQSSYTIEDARRAKLVRSGGNWEKNPGEMLRARATSKGVRMVMPGIVAGVYAPEDFEELSPAQEAATSSRKRTAATTATTPAVSSTPAAHAEPVIDATVDPMVTATQAEAAPFDTGDSVNDLTTVLMEIELILGQIGMTKADLEAGMKKKNPAFTTIDDLAVDQAKQILERLRAKKQASQAA